MNELIYDTIISIGVGSILALVFGLTFIAQYSQLGSQDPTYGSQIGALSIPGYIAPTDLCLSKPFSEKRSRNFLAENFEQQKVAQISLLTYKEIDMHIHDIICQSIGLVMALVIILWLLPLIVVVVILALITTGIAGILEYLRKRVDKSQPQ